MITFSLPNIGLGDKQVVDMNVLAFKFIFSIIFRKINIRLELCSIFETACGCNAQNMYSLPGTSTLNLTNLTVSVCEL